MLVFGYGKYASVNVYGYDCGGLGASRRRKCMLENRVRHVRPSISLVCPL